MKLQLKRSNVLEGGFAKAPTTAQMEYGELAVNYNLDDPCIFLKDSNNNIIRISSKGVPALGDTNLQSGTLDERYPLKSGDTFTGEMILSGDPVNNLGAVTKQYVDNSIAAVDLPAENAVGPNPPANPGQGDLWWSTEDGNLYVYYQDGDSNQWVASKPDYEAAINIGDLLDVQTAGAVNGQALMWSAADAKWVPMDASQITSVNGLTGDVVIETLNHTISTTAPTDPNTTDLWSDTSESATEPLLKTWTGSAWVTVGASLPSEYTGVINNVTLTENDPTGDRFTSQTFDVAIDMLREGNPFTQKGLKGEVTASFAQYPAYEPVASNSVTYAANNQAPSVGNQMSNAYGQGPVAYGPINATGYGYVWLEHYDGGNPSSLYVRTSPDISNWPGTGAIAATKSVANLSQTRYGQYFEPTSASPNGYYLFYNDFNDLNPNASSETVVGAATVSPSGDITGFTGITRLGKTFKHNNQFYYLDGSMRVCRSDIPIGNDASEVRSGTISYYGKNVAPIGINNGYFVWCFWMSSGDLYWASLPVDFTAGQTPSYNVIMYNDTNDIVTANTAGGYFWFVKNRTLFRSSNGSSWSNLGELGDTGAGEYKYIRDIRENPDTGDVELYYYLNGNSYIISSNNGGGSWQPVWNYSGATGENLMHFNSNMILKKGGATRYLKAWPWGTQTVTLSGQGADYSSLNVNDTIHPQNNYDANAYGRITAISGNNITIDSGYIYQAGDVIEGFNPISSGVSTRFLVIDATGAVSGTVGADPGYVNVGPNTSQTLTFPATFPSGDTPDDELPAGTTIKVSAQATNSVGSTEFGPSNIVTPS